MYKLSILCISTLFFGICSALGDFASAVVFVRNSKPIRMSDDKKLKVYALYKQATIGDCPKSGSGEFDPYRRATLNAWYAVKGMNKLDAENQYVKIIDEFVPGWRNL